MQGRNGHGDASILGKTRGKHIMSVNVRVNVLAIFTHSGCEK